MEIAWNYERLVKTINKMKRNKTATMKFAINSDSLNFTFTSRLTDSAIPLRLTKFPS